MLGKLSLPCLSLLLMDGIRDHNSMAFRSGLVSLVRVITGAGKVVKLLLGLASLTYYSSEFTIRKDGLPCC